MTQKKNRLWPLCVALLIPLSLQGKINVVHQSPDATHYYYFLALKGAHEHLAGNYQRSHETYKNLLKFTPDDPALISAALRLEFDHSHFVQVLALADKLDMKDPKNKELTFLVAQSYLFLNKNNEGIDLLEFLRTQHPQDDRFDYFTAISYSKIGQEKEALSIIEEVLSQKNKIGRHYLFYFLRAKNAYTHDSLDVAFNDIGRSIENNPSFAKGFFLRGAILEKQGDYPRACQAYKRYLSLSPPDAATEAKVAALSAGTP